MKEKMKFFELVPNNMNFDFIGKFKLFVFISVLSVGASVAGMLTRGFNFGIDFTGGTVVQVKFSEPRAIDEVRRTMDELGAKEASVVAMDQTGIEYMITARAIQDTKEKNLPQQIVDKIGADKVTISQADVVGPKVGSELKASAIRSLIYTVILIMVYIWFRFDFKFAPGATVALVHDMTVAAGYYVLTQREFDITAIAALLTIAGYSVNDTIVIYDRVREMMKVGGDKLPLAQTINKAINLTLSRTVITSGATFLTIIPIAIYCEGPIQDFAETMLIGIFIGTYSTYYIAAPMTIYVEKFLAKRAPKNTRRTAKV
jgi:preprotein translocase subunit SecF